LEENIHDGIVKHIDGNNEDLVTMSQGFNLKPTTNTFKSKSMLLNRDNIQARKRRRKLANAIKSSIYGTVDQRINNVPVINTSLDNYGFE